MNTENQFKEGQEVWVKARICNDELDRYGDLKLNITYSHGSFLAHCLPSEIRTTEQIVQEHGALAPQNAPDGTINLMLCLTKEEYKHLKYCVSWHEPCGEYEEKLDETIYNKLFYSNTTATPHFATEPDRSRKFIKGDKVKRREAPLYGRKLDSLSAHLPHGKTLIVETEEDSNGEVGIFFGGITRYVPFFILDLVEPAPEPKYWLDESPMTYSIYYKGEFDKINAAMILRKNLYTLEEAHEQLDKLIQKGQNNEI